jgi:hypothetical protein
LSHGRFHGSLSRLVYSVQCQCRASIPRRPLTGSCGPDRPDRSLHDRGPDADMQHHAPAVRDFAGYFGYSVSYFRAAISSPVLKKQIPCRTCPDLTSDEVCKSCRHPEPHQPERGDRPPDLRGRRGPGVPYIRGIARGAESRDIAAAPRRYRYRMSNVQS